MYIMIAALSLYIYVSLSLYTYIYIYVHLSLSLSLSLSILMETIQLAADRTVHPNLVLETPTSIRRLDIQKVINQVEGVYIYIHT